MLVQGKPEVSKTSLRRYNSLSPQDKSKSSRFRITQGKYQEFTEADTTLLRKAGYERPMTSLEDGVRQYYDLWKRTGGYRRD